MTRIRRVPFLIFSLTAVSVVPCLYGQATGTPTPAVNQAVSDSSMVTLSNNTRPEATADNDLGLISDSFQMDHMLLQLQRSPEREAAFATYIAQLTDRTSPNFHKWLTAAQYAQHFGVAQADVTAVTAWLTAKGFAVNGVQADGMLIDFSGTAGQVRQAFRTEIHNLNVNGAQHFGNMSDPQIPAALAPVVAGVVSLHNFFPKPQSRPRGNYNYAGGAAHALVPGDIAAIYNLNPLFAAGYSGKGQTIMVVEDTYLYTTSDWTVFRKTFGLTRPYPSGTLAQVSPTGSVACTNPGYAANGDDGEAIIDVEWATAAAPNAAIVLAACKNTGSTFGGLIALENTLNGPPANLPTVVSISYGEAEAANGATANLAYKNAYMQASGMGISIFVSSGDENAGSDDGGNVSTHGIGISGFTSTPYNVSVGGTDFGYTANGNNPSNYWASTNSSTYTSALGYIQEIPWNGSCGSTLLAAYYGALAGAPTDPAGFCNSADVTTMTSRDNFFLNDFGGSGGPSGCATGTRSTTGVVSGTCAGYAKPVWQTGIVGNPADGVRDIPDVSLFASNGIFDAYYVTCWSNPSTSATEGGGFTCTGAPSTWAGFGGTSVSSPIMAAIQALVNQKTGSNQGLPNPTYYALANTEYGATGSAPCNSSTVSSPSACIFYDITQGDIVGACEGSGSQSTTLRNCYRASGNTIGLVSTSNATDIPAYLTNVGWDFPTGIGSVNAYNLVMNWPTAP